MTILVKCRTCVFKRQIGELDKENEIWLVEEAIRFHIITTKHKLEFVEVH